MRRVTRPTIYGYLKRGDLKATRIGTKFLLSKDDINNMFNHPADFKLPPKEKQAITEFYTTAEIIEKFTRAIQKGLDYVHNSSDEEVANAILSFFPDTSLNDLAGVIERYRSIDAWPTTTKFSSESFYHLQEIMQAANELNSAVKYEDLIYTRD